MPSAGTILIYKAEVGCVAGCLSHPLAARSTIGTHRILLQRGMTDQPLQVIGDRIQLQQVLLNLTINAIDAMSSVSGRDRLLTIASGIDENGMVRITVEDMGSGIDPTHLDRIPSFSLRQNPLEWGWGFAFVAQSLKHMVANSGRRHEVLSERSSSDDAERRGQRQEWPSRGSSERTMK